MPQEMYLPEGRLLESAENRQLTTTEEGLLRAWEHGITLESVATMCDERRDLYVRLGNFRGRIPREEAGLGADRGRLREIAILSRVGKPVCFRIIGREGDSWLLSRRAVQEEAHGFFRQNLCPGDVIMVTVTHLEQFGAFVDMGRGLVSMIGIDTIAISRIGHTSERFVPGQKAYAVVSRVEPGGRICLTHRELLGNWQENADRLRAGSAVRGIVRGVEPYGVFVELAPNLSGLAEPCTGASVGQEAAVYIKSILPERMKVKLSVLDLMTGTSRRLIRPEDYRITQGHISRWQYQPDRCTHHCVESVFA